MEIYGLQVTSNYFEEIDSTGCHIELANNIRFVYLEDTEYNTMEDLKTALEALIL